MALLKFNKTELVNLSYSLRREIILANNTGAYCNTSIVTCNTRRYHGLLAVTLDRFGGDKYLLLSSLDETLTISGKQFNLGIHCYGGMYDPRGHKYIVDFEVNPTPRITYKVGDVILSKTLALSPDSDRVFIKYQLESSAVPVTLELKPFLPFRNIHALTQQNDVADPTPGEIEAGRSFCLYKEFPSLNLQLSDAKAKFVNRPCWYNKVTYSDEYRRGFDCREDLLVPGYFTMTLKPGTSVIFSASTSEEDKSMLTRSFNAAVKKAGQVTTVREQLACCAETLKSNHNNRRRINAGFSWLYTGLLRETLMALPGLTLYANGSKAEFEEILDNLIYDEQERLFHRTTQVEAPLYLAVILQKYIDFGADAAAVWKKYGSVQKKIIESYKPGVRAEVTMHPNGLLWAQMEHVALSWMNAYVGGNPVTERAGYQVETNALWYNSICFALDMEQKYGAKRGGFIKEWTPVRDMIMANYQRTFWNDYYRCLADYVDNSGQHLEMRPNQLYALWMKYRPVQNEIIPDILRMVDNELVTRRGIRTLSPRDVRYKGVYDGTQIDRDLAYHQGCAMPFLLEPYVEICFEVKGPSFWKKAEWLTEGFFEDLGKHGVGAFSELYDGDPPHEPHGAISSALSTAALLSVMYMMDKNKEGGK